MDRASDGENKRVVVVVRVEEKKKSFGRLCSRSLVQAGRSGAARARRRFEWLCVGWCRTERVAMNSPKPKVSTYYLPKHDKIAILIRVARNDTTRWPLRGTVTIDTAAAVVARTELRRRSIREDNEFTDPRWLTPSHGVACQRATNIRFATERTDIRSYPVHFSNGQLVPDSEHMSPTRLGFIIWWTDFTVLIINKKHNKKYSAREVL